MSVKTLHVVQSVRRVSQWSEVTDVSSRDIVLDQSITDHSPTFVWTSNGLKLQQENPTDISGGLFYNIVFGSNLASRLSYRPQEGYTV